MGLNTTVFGNDPLPLSIKWLLLLSFNCRGAGQKVMKWD